MLRSDAPTTPSVSPNEELMDAFIRLQEKAEAISKINTEYYNEIRRLHHVNGELQQRISILEQNASVIQEAYDDEVTRNSELEEYMTQQKRDVKNMIRHIDKLSDAVYSLRTSRRELTRQNSNQQMTLNSLKREWKRNSKARRQSKAQRRSKAQKVSSFSGPLQPKESVSSHDCFVASDDSHLMPPGTRCTNSRKSVSDYSLYGHGAASRVLSLDLTMEEIIDFESFDHEEAEALGITVQNEIEGLMELQRQSKDVLSDDVHTYRD